MNLCVHFVATPEITLNCIVFLVIIPFSAYLISQANVANVASVLGRSSDEWMWIYLPNISFAEDFSF